MQAATKLGSAHSLKRRIAAFVCAFACVFGGLALLRGPGPAFTRAHLALGNALVASLHLASGTRLYFRASDAELTEKPWQAVLRVEPLTPERGIAIPIDLRSLVYLPLAAFVALAVAVPLRSVRAHLLLVFSGLVILEPLLLSLIAVPLISFLGGLGPVHAFAVSRAMQVLLQLVYRALVAPPGMAYALPLLLWWMLVRRAAGRDAHSATPPLRA